MTHNWPEIQEARLTSGDVVFVSRDDERRGTPASLLVQLCFPYHILCDHLADNPRIKSIPESTTKRCKSWVYILTCVIKILLIKESL